jgi:4,5:9,10-diseco-3-hydroxy-5,9,17-trioxoandrosta-1(10),2-diene-4-oate hydrolase
MKISNITANGVRIAYYEQGDGPVLVLIHGMFGDHRDWAPVLAPLARHFRVLALDLPGFGASEKPENGYSGTFFISTLHEFFEQTHIKKFSLMGNSFGGQVSLLYALKHPEQVEQLVLVDSGGFRNVTTEEKTQTCQVFSEKNLLALKPEAISSLFTAVFSGDSEEKSRYLEKQAVKLSAPDFPAYAHALACSIQVSLSTYLLERLREITCPTALIWGEQDAVVPVEQAQQALTMLSHGSLHVLQACGHMPQLESPGEFVETVKKLFHVTGTP